MASAVQTQPAAIVPSNAKRSSLLLKKLSAMSYSLPPSLHPLFSSLPPQVTSLVETLFNDLVTTTEAYEGLVEREEATGDELRRAQASVFPLRKENTSLVRENNQLHLEMIKAEDEAGKRLVQGG